MSRTPTLARKLLNSTMKMKNETPLLTVPSRSSLKKHAFYGILALVSLLGLGITQSAQATPTAPGQGDPFTLQFDENGHGLIDFRDGNGFQLDPSRVMVDPNTGVSALTYRLGVGSVTVGIVDVRDSGRALSDAISFYNDAHGQGWMAYYSTLPGTDLADTISGGYVPLSSSNVFEVGDTFAYFSGGTPGADNDYYGVSGVPDGGSTLALLGLASLGLVALRRKLRC